MFYVYKILNKVNNKIYIGQTNKPDWRWRQHVYRAKNNPHQLISRSISKYGEDNFEFNVIFFSDSREVVNDTEEFFINYFNSKNLEFGYNVANGGSVGKMSDYLRSKISEGLLDYYKTHDSPIKGRNLSESHRKSLSKSAMGKKGTNLGKKFTKEHCERISKALTGKKYPNRKSFKTFKDPHNKKITDEQAIEIKELSKKYSRVELANMFNVSTATISCILSNKTHRKTLLNDEPIKHIRKKLTRVEAKDIKDMLSNNCSRKEIIEKFGITKRCLRKIINGQSFGDV